MGFLLAQACVACAEAPEPGVLVGANGVGPLLIGPQQEDIPGACGHRAWPPIRPGWRLGGASFYHPDRFGTARATVMLRQQCTTHSE